MPAGHRRACCVKTGAGGLTSVQPLVCRAAVASIDMSGVIIRTGQDDMDWLASEETQRVAKVATGVGLRDLVAGYAVCVLAQLPPVGTRLLPRSTTGSCASATSVA
ncbi:hypothetical protein CWS02_14015 [Enterobacter sp. EA-1]|nr:hypothetical protein CWS02_14015 [Enterobacter sp. EA-1]